MHFACQCDLLQAARFLKGSLHAPDMLIPPFNLSEYAGSFAARLPLIIFPDLQWSPRKKIREVQQVRVAVSLDDPASFGTMEAVAAAPDLRLVDRVCQHA